MSRPLVYLPEVSRDFAEGFNYYEQFSPGKGGARFEAAFRAALRQVEDGLITHARAFGHYHRLLLPKYPYHLYYRLDGERAVIAGLLYARFEPKRIERILKGRLR